MEDSFLGKRIGRMAVIFFACYFAAAAVTLLAAPLPQMILPWESFVFYEGGWRVLQGIRPHVDFYSPLEPLTDLIVALGMMVSGNSFSSLGWGIVLVSLPLAVASWFLLSRRLTPFLCLLACLYVLGTWMVPFPLRFGFRNLTYGGFYNREGYALMGLLVFLLLFPRCENQKKDRADGLASGVLLGLIAGIKINFFIIAGLFVGFHLLGRKNRFSHCKWIGYGFALIALPLLAYIRFDIRAVWQDFTTLALSHSPGTLSACIAVVLRDMPLPAFFNLIALAIEATARFQTSATGGGAGRDLLISRGLEFVVFMGAQFLALLSNAPEGGNPDIPLLDIYGLIQAQRLTPYLRLGKVSSKLHPWVLGAILGVVYPAMRSFLLFFLGFGFCFLVSISHLCDSYFIPLKVRWEGREEVLRVGKYGYNVDFVASFEDGKALLSRHVDIHRARIGSFDETNPFSFSFRGRSAPGMPTFWQEGRNVSLLGYPPAEKVFRDCDCLMVPKPGVVPSTAPLLTRIYADTLRNKYFLVEGTQYWDLYMRRSQ